MFKEQGNPLNLVASREKIPQQNLPDVKALYLQPGE